MRKKLEKADFGDRIAAMNGLVERLGGTVVKVITERDSEGRSDFIAEYKYRKWSTIMFSTRAELFHSVVAKEIVANMIPCLLLREAMHVDDKPNEYGNYFNSPLVEKALKTHRSVEAYLHGKKASSVNSDANYTAKKKAAEYAIGLWPAIEECIEGGCSTQEQIAQCLTKNDKTTENGSVISQTIVGRYIKRISEFGPDNAVDKLEEFALSRKMTS